MFVELLVPLLTIGAVMIVACLLWYLSSAYRAQISRWIQALVRHWLEGRDAVLALGVLTKLSPIEGFILRHLVRHLTVSRTWGREYLIRLFEVAEGQRRVQIASIARQPLLFRSGLWTWLLCGCEGRGAGCRLDATWILRFLPTGELGRFMWTREERARFGEAELIDIMEAAYLLLASIATSTVGDTGPHTMLGVTALLSAQERSVALAALDAELERRGHGTVRSKDVLITLKTLLKRRL